MKTGVVGDLQEIGFAASMLEAQDVLIDVQLNDAATQGINNLINRIEALKVSLSSVGGQLIDVSVNGDGGGPGGGGGGTTTVFINEQVSRSDVSNIIVESNREEDRG